MTNDGKGNYQLSAREREVLQALMQGASNKEIACRLGITGGTVATYIARLCAGLDCRDRSELKLLALTQPDAMSEGRAGRAA